MDVDAVPAPLRERLGLEATGQVLAISGIVGVMLRVMR